MCSLARAGSGPVGVALGHAYRGAAKYGQTPAVKGKPGPERPNIVFVMLDDVGIDQMELFGNGGFNPPSLPNIDKLAESGMTFSNVWAMPECSPTRAAFFTGRYPLRTGVTSAITSQMLPHAQLSPYETTLPRLLSTAGYTSAMSGKYHLGNDNPSGNCSPATRGWDFFDGNLGADPPAIDTQAGSPSTTPVRTYNCGFVRESEAPGGIASGACYFDEGACEDGFSGKQCLESGGLLVPGEACAEETPAFLDFDATNGYYVWPNTVNDGSLPAPSGCDGSGRGCADLECPIGGTGEPPLSRGYMTTEQTQTAVEWWHRQDGPRMLTVSYNSIHTPFQPPPTSSDDDPVDALVCQGENASRNDNLALSKAMLENMDQQIAQLLAGLGLATLDDQGNISTLHLDAMNTLLVIIGDNGTSGPIVRQLPFDPRLPKGSVRFDPTLPKGSVFQTGVWVPLVVAGSLVEGPLGRDVDALINSVDLFELFAEIAGLDPREVVPPAHRLDSRSMLPYLTDPDQEPIRQFNFTQLGATGTIPIPIDPERRLWPCVLFSTVNETIPGSPKLEGGVCVDLLFDTSALCRTNAGIWLGPDPDPAFENKDAAEPDTPNGAWPSCCNVLGEFSAAHNPVRLAPLEQFAVRDKKFKLSELVSSDCRFPVDDPEVFPPFEEIRAVQFFNLEASPVDFLQTEICTAVDAVSPDGPRCNDGIITPAFPFGNQCANAPACLGAAALVEAFSSLAARLDRTKRSPIECRGDGNLDKRVDELDLAGVERFMASGPSYFDMNRDGQTDAKDRDIVLANLGNDCLGACGRADLNQDNRVTSDDEAILLQSLGRCDVNLAAAVHLCGADLNADGWIDEADLEILRKTRSQMKGTPCSPDRTVADQTAVFLTFTASILDLGVSTSISVSNPLAWDPMSPFLSLSGSVTKGTIEIYLWDQAEGELISYETSDDSVGVGLNPDGTLSPRGTWRFLLSEVLVAAGWDDDFVGYGWVVANFGGVVGSHTVNYFAIGFSQPLLAVPAIGQGIHGTAGLPVRVPP